MRGCDWRSADADGRGLEAQDGLLIGPFEYAGGVGCEAGGFAPELLEHGGAARRRAPARAGHSGGEGLAALLGREEMILDRDGGNELIDAQAGAAGAIGEQRIVRGQGGAGGQFQIAGCALPAEDVSRAALMAAMQSGELAAAC